MAEPAGCLLGVADHKEIVDPLGNSPLKRGESTAGAGGVSLVTVSGMPIEGHPLQAAPAAPFEGGMI
jgi:hypothetical protein